MKTGDARGEAYAAEISRMAKQAQEWIASHPEAVIQLTRPAGVIVSAALFEALASGLVRVSDDTRRMFQDLGWLRNTAELPHATDGRNCNRIVKAREAMSLCIKTRLPCPACGHGLNKEITGQGTTWLWCGNIFCVSQVCDNGAEGITEHEAFLLLCIEQETEKPKPEPEPELSADEEEELRALRHGEWKYETQKGEPAS